MNTLDPLINKDEFIQHNVGGGFGSVVSEGGKDYYVSKSDSSRTLLGDTKQDTSPTISEVYSGYVPQSNNELDSAYQSYGDILKSQTTPVDEAQIRANTLARFQAEIDALDKVYAEKKAQARVQGENKLGSTVAIGNRRGLTGSDFGESQKQVTTNYNNEIIAGIDAELNARKQAILSDARTNADEEIKAKNEARLKGAEDYISFLSTQAERKSQRVSTTIQNLLNNDVDPDEQMYQQLATTLGVSVQQLKSEYGAKKTELTSKKDLITVSPGSSIYDPNTGEFLGTAPERPSDSKPVTQEVGKTLLQYDPTSDSWKSVYTDTTAEDSDPTTIGGQNTGYYQYNSTTGQWEQVIKGVTETKPPTQAESMAAGFATRIEQSLQNMNDVESKVVDKLTNQYSFARKIPDRFKDGDVKAQIQAEENFINAILRRESGAAISDAEYDRAARQYFPQAGDTEQVLKQKRQNRETVLQSLVQQAGSAYQPTTPIGIPEQDIADFMNEKGVDRATAEASLNQALQNGLYSFNKEEQTSLKGKHNRERTVTQKITNKMMEAHPEGSEGGQCTTFLHKIVDFPPIGDGKNEKIASIKKFGLSTDEWRKQPKIGDVVVTNENPTYAHTAVVLDIKPNGDLVFGESNYKKSDTVSYGRTLNINSPKILGAFRGKFKL